MSSATVVVVTHNSEGVVDDCLRSCSGLDVVVVDNASRDETVERVARYSRVHLIANRENRGFAGAVNQAVESIDSDFILLLNPDVRLLDSPAPLVAFLDQDRGCGIAAGLLINADGSPQRGFTARRFPTAAALIFEVLGINRVFPRNSVNRNYRYFDRNFTAPIQVDQPAGAFLLFRKEVWLALGGFDERFYPVWFEDVDFCRRAKDGGWGIVIVPSVRATHGGGHSVRQLTPESRELAWYGSLLRYAAKHLPAWKVRTISTAVVLGSLLRAIAGTAVLRSLKPLTICSKVLRLSAGCIRSGSVCSDSACEWRLQTGVNTVHAQKQE